MPTERSCWSHMVRLSIESSQKGLEVRAEEVDGRNMSGVQQDGAMTAESLSLNASAALGLHDQETNAAALFGRLHQPCCRTYFGLTSLKLPALMFATH